MNQSKNGVRYAVTGILMSALLGILLSLFLLLVDVHFLLNLVFIVLGILTVLNNLPSLVFSVAEFRTKEGKLLFVLSLIATVLGILMIFFHNGIFMILLGVYFVLVPVLRLIFSRDRAELLREELPKLILGVVMILLGPAYMVSILFRIAGWVVLALTVISAIGSLIGLHKSVHKTGTRVFVDHDGDGKVDAIYVDTTGDGKVDAATRFRDEQ
ncbi:MAG: hypothetical protein IJW16_01880 [Clostridia bacterium]|nr:hypothetical protein [Clostridia bacterium]